MRMRITRTNPVDFALVTLRTIKGLRGLSGQQRDPMHMCG